MRYENFVREHQHFDTSYIEFLELVKSLSEELKQHSEVVGDLGLLQVNNIQFMLLINIFDFNLNIF